MIETVGRLEVSRLSLKVVGRMIKSGGLRIVQGLKAMSIKVLSHDRPEFESLSIVSKFSQKVSKFNQKVFAYSFRVQDFLAIKETQFESTHRPPVFTL